MSDSPGPDQGSIKSYLNSDELRSLQRSNPTRVAADIAATWVLILGALALSAAYPNPLVLVACFLVISTRQLALTHLVHDASHFRLSKSRRWNDLLSDLLLAGPVAISTESYRLQHLLHHKHLGDWEQDSDQRTWYSLSGINFLKRTVLTLLGVEALATFRSYARAGGGSGGETASLLWRLCCTALGNGLLLLYCWWLGQPWLYFSHWFLPLLSLTMLLQTYRVIAEHQTIDYAARGIDNLQESIRPPLTRTLRAGVLEKFMLGPMNFHYHHEHHLAPSVPYHRLPAMHQMLLEKGYYTKHPLALGRGYTSTLRKLVKSTKTEVASSA